MKIAESYSGLGPQQVFYRDRSVCGDHAFLDKNDLFTRLDEDRQLRELEQSARILSSANSCRAGGNDKLRTNPATLEKICP